VRDDRLRLGDILEAIERIEKYSQRREALYSDELVQTWVVHHLMIIGEACRSLSDKFRANHPEDVWALAGGVAQRNCPRVLRNRFRDCVGRD
jgi:uncharacterized protein with HEPN domain